MSKRVLSQVATYITADDPFYITQYSDYVARQFEDSLKGFFIWVKASALDLSANDEEVEAFAVIFCICSEERLRAINLAKALLDFMKVHSTDEALELACLSYEFVRGGVIGVLFFDERLKKSFENVLEKAKDHVSGYDMFEDRPVTFYPAGRALRVAKTSYESVFNGTKGLCFDESEDDKAPTGKGVPVAL
ncbi:hypothetical protein NMY22_g16883 [Coprinellus aureogranulatus]|nr:hypothetical protein NMY22_g16883 [Coprinellus aureogranulatus]